MEIMLDKLIEKYGSHYETDRNIISYDWGERRFKKSGGKYAKLLGSRSAGSDAGAVEDIYVWRQKGGSGYASLVLHTDNSIKKYNSLRYSIWDADAELDSERECKKFEKKIKRIKDQNDRSTRDKRLKNVKHQLDGL